MTEEIKEIFRRMNDLIEHRFDKEYHTECDLFKDIQDLLDYITNLQQENEKLKENAEHNDKVVDKARWNEMIYKSRVEKVDEYIDKQKKKMYKSRNKIALFILMKLENILNGDDENG